MNQIDLKGRVAVVTGGAQGIGYAIAERMLASGASVSLWDADAEYWVPVGPDNYDPTLKVSIVYDDRSLLAARVRKIVEGGAYAEDPPTAVTRTISNVLIGSVTSDTVTGDGELVHLRARFVLIANRRGRATIWAGGLRYRLRVTADDIRLVAKTVLLANSSDPLPDVVFLL